MNIRNVSDLKQWVSEGKSVRYVFFWGHQKPKSGVTKSCFSQWYEAEFSEAGVLYKTAEHYMMAEKARLFADKDSEQKIIAASNPGEAKKIGRLVANFEESKWLARRFDIVVNANMAKFSQNRLLGEFLVNTGNRVIVEASPVDKIWGIGLEAKDPKAENPNEWKGENLLGFALMAVRSRLLEVTV